MMIAFRILLIATLMSGSVVLSMEKAVSIDRLWNAIMPTKSVLACELDDVTCVALYLYNGGNINATGTVILDNFQEIRGMNLLMGCTMYGRPKLMKSLIRWGAPLDCTNGFGDTALMIAAWYGRASLARLLLKAGADPLVRNQYGANALWCAENTPLRYHPDYNNKLYKNRYIPKMINSLKRAQEGAIWRIMINDLQKTAQFSLEYQKSQVVNHSQLRIQHSKDAEKVAVPRKYQKAKNHSQLRIQQH